ncbi:DEAD/DEAH box helicase [bacterium]|nr:DEAD/DEAH box helicase [bacterium]
MKFAQLGLSTPITRAIAKAGLVTPTPIQVLAIPEALAGRDVLGAAETGTGKTAAFALPLLQRLSKTTPPRHPLLHRVRALIITPTRELALQIGQQFTSLGRYCGLTHATLVTPGDRLLRSIDILIATPERLLDLHQHGGVDLRAVEILVIDEADRLLDMNRLPDVQRIISQLPLDRQTMLYSATLPAAINSLADVILREPARIRIPPTQKATDAVRQSVSFVSRPQKTSLLVAWLNQHHVDRAIVFTRTKHGADRVVRQLLTCGIRAEAIHGEKTLAARQETLARFKAAHPPILVATDLAARGIDVDHVSHVLNYDLPLEPETYIHRVGRMAKAGAKGMAVTFCDDSERPLLKSIEKLLRREIPVDSATQPLDQLPRTKLAPLEPAPTPAPQRKPRPSQAAKEAAAAEVVTRKPVSRAKPVSSSHRTSSKAIEATGKTKATERSRTKTQAKAKVETRSKRNTASSKKTPVPARGAVASRRR